MTTAASQFATMLRELLRQDRYCATCQRVTSHIGLYFCGFRFIHWKCASCTHETNQDIQQHQLTTQRG